MGEDRGDAPGVKVFNPEGDWFSRCTRKPSLNHIIITQKRQPISAGFIPRRRATKSPGHTDGSMPSERGLSVNGGKERRWILFLGILVCLIQNNVSEDAGKRTAIQPDPRRLVSAVLYDFITQTRQSRQAAQYEHRGTEDAWKTFQANV